MWSLLYGPVDWDAYRTKMSAELSLAGFGVDWGKGPKEYPCLVCSVQVGPLRVMSAYCYAADATRLLQAGTAVTPTSPAPATAPAPLPTRVGPAQDDHNKWVAAHLLTLTHYVRETLCVTPEAFEQKLNEALSLVDQVSSERRDEFLVLQDATNRTMMERLRPKPE